MVENYSNRAVSWADYPSWRQFSWLYLMAGVVAGRAWLYWRFGFSGWMDWTIGAVVLLGIAAIIRHWAHYEILSTRLVVRNGYTGHEIGCVELTEVDQVEIRQGAIAARLGIGTVVVLSNGQPRLRFRGVSDPEGVKRRIEMAIRMPIPESQCHGNVA